MKKLLGIILAFASCALFAEDKLVGEYVGTIKAEKGNFRANPQLAFQVYKEENTYKVVITQDLWKRSTNYAKYDAKAQNGVIYFENLGQYKFTGEIDGNSAKGKITDKDKDVAFDVEFSIDKIDRKSPTLAAKAPKNAIVLFDGKNFNEWRMANNKDMNWTLGKDADGMGYMQVFNSRSGGNSDIVTKKKFKKFKMHIEFYIPNEMHMTLGQHRGNSGIFMGRFEIQVLDSFGADGLWNECGALYKVMPPHVNYSLPPEKWQTYDIEYEGPEYKHGKMTELPEITVYHNGKLIHKDFEIYEGTEHEGRNRDISRMGDGPVEIKLQNHGNSIRFRNIWLVEDK